MGGVAAALAALRLGKTVILSEETFWLGGQMTAQGVPPDEHTWIEETGCTTSYRRLRNGIRQYYREYYPLTHQARANPLLNPGQGSVSKLCHEPRISLAVVEQMLAPYRPGLQLQVLLRHRPLEADVDGDRVRAVTLESLDTGRRRVIQAAYVLDATELGDLLALTGTEHVTGAESQAQTGELHARDDAPDPLEQQPFSWCFAMDYTEGADFTIARPAEYDFWRRYQADFWPDKLLSWTYFRSDRSDPHLPTDLRRPAQERRPVRPLAFPAHPLDGALPAGLYPSDIVVVNWPQIDYWLSPLVGVSEEEAQHNLQRSRQLSLAMLYWMQTEAPRPDSGQRLPRAAPARRYHRDGRWAGHGRPISARAGASRPNSPCSSSTWGSEARPGGQMGPKSSPIRSGSAPTASTCTPRTGRNYVDISSYPFQIPLGALMPLRMDNLLPACKNLGVTHITNGCYRLHPVEWNIGEAAGALAAWCLEKKLSPRQVRANRGHLVEFQRCWKNSSVFNCTGPKKFAAQPATRPTQLLASEP